jgi:AraC-like DNA-binding protein/quercetin dioxygenase-like cupin family protein
MKSRRLPDNPSQNAPEFFSTNVTAARRFNLNLSPDEKKSLVVVCGGLEHCSRDYTINRQTFPFYSIEYVAGGRGRLRLGAKSCTLQPGRLFAYGPGIPHHITGEVDDPFAKYFVDFAGTQAKAFLHSCGLSPGSVLEVFPANSPQAIFDELIEVGSILRLESGDLCAKLLECLLLRIKGARAPLENTETLGFTTYQKCRRHIEQHSLRLKALHQIAGECNVNSSYLCRLFQRYDKQSPYQYLLRLKLNIAAERLQKSGGLVKQIAREIGFIDQFHFSRVFTSVFGMSPTAFRSLR